MTPQRILILYGSQYGQTAKIAGRLARQLAERGHAVELFRGDAPPAGLDLGRYDAAIIGASVIRGHFQKYVRRFVATHRDALNRMPSAFFSVSGSERSVHVEERAKVRALIQDFLTGTRWSPLLTVSLAGAVSYTKYGLVVRYVMKRISRREGGSTDTSRDHEYTDWRQVDRFGDDFASIIGGGPVPEPARLETAPEPEYAT